MPTMTGKVALITGAGGGIGRATARLFAERGAQVVATDVSEAGLEETAALIRDAGGEVTTLGVDVANRPLAKVGGGRMPGSGFRRAERV
jgi:NAD(P)-dependent dehydrogenase (short-subunit alcohol dehydrogenase family)